MISKAAVAAAIATLVARRVTAAPLSEPDVTTKVVGGNVAPDGAFPYIVSLSSGGNHFCGGSLLNEEYVVTAAHCLFEPPPNIQVRVGSNDRTTGGTVVNGIEPRTHPGFTMEALDNDVAVLKLSPPVKRSAKVDFVKMPQKNSDPQEGAKTVAGWGLLQDKGPGLPQDLRQVSLPLISRQQCNQLVSSQTGRSITDNMICAGQGDKDSCNGDSGGPLVDSKTTVLEGIVSHGFGCANQNLPGVYARVDTQLDFIQGVMGGQSPTQPGPPSQSPGVDPGNPSDPGDGSFPGPGDNNGGTGPIDGSFPGPGDNNGGTGPIDGSFPGPGDNNGGIGPIDGSFPGPGDNNGGIGPIDGSFPGPGDNNGGIGPIDGSFPGPGGTVGGISPIDGSLANPEGVGGGIVPSDGSFPFPGGNNGGIV